MPAPARGKKERVIILISTALSMPFLITYYYYDVSEMTLAIFHYDPKLMMRRVSSKPSGLGGARAPLALQQSHRQAIHFSKTSFIPALPLTDCA